MRSPRPLTGTVGRIVLSKSGTTRARCWFPLVEERTRTLQRDFDETLTEERDA
jgi:hypothetical protein